MSDYLLITDSTSELSDEYCEQHNIYKLHLSCILNGEVYGKNKKLDIKEFYDGIRNGTLPTTSQINPEEAKAEFLECLKEYKKLIYIAFTSGLSGTYQSGVIAANEIMEEQPDVKIQVIDSLCASMGEGLLVHKAVEKRDSGASFEETVAYIESIKMNIAHVVAVDDLFHLFRGGRVSRTSAIVGSMIGIKPMIHVNDEGKLINVGKVRGRKKSLLTLVDMMAERIGSFNDKEKNSTIAISHSDCPEEAQFVAEAVKKKFGFDNCMIEYIGPVIGSHTGANTIALFFLADKR